MPRYSARRLRSKHHRFQTPSRAYSLSVYTFRTLFWNREEELLLRASPGTFSVLLDLSRRNNLTREKLEIIRRLDIQVFAVRGLREVRTLDFFASFFKCIERMPFSRFTLLELSEGLLLTLRSQPACETCHSRKVRCDAASLGVVGKLLKITLSHMLTLSYSSPAPIALRSPSNVGTHNSENNIIQAMLTLRTCRQDPHAEEKKDTKWKAKGF
jgi:hypothetical protein